MRNEKLTQTKKRVETMQAKIEVLSNDSLQSARSRYK